MTLDWMRTSRLTYEVDFEPRVLRKPQPGDAAWRNLDVTPNVEYARKNWLDLVGEIATGYTKQTDDTARVLAVGGFLALVGVPVPGVEIGVALSALLLGAMVALEGRPPLVAAAVLVGAFAIFHGHAHGAELPPGQSGLAYSIGFVVATGCLHGVGITIGTIHQWRSGRLVLRFAGVFVALAGAGFVWKALG